MGNDLANIPTDAVPWYKRSYLLKLNFCIFSLVLFSSANGYDGSIMGSLLALPRWNAFMHNPSGYYLGWINAIYWLGNGIGYPIGSYVANRWGRKPGVYVGYVFLLAAVGMQTGATHESHFTYARLLIGIASAWFGVNAPLLINEVAHPKHRSILSAFFMCGWYVGGTLSAWLTFGTRNLASSWSWRIPVVFQLLLPLLALPGFLMVPESPRWLISQGRSEEAREILATCHAGGDSDDALVNYQMIEIEATITAEKEAVLSASYASMLKSPGNRHRLFISVTLGIFSQWVGNGVVSYYLPLILNSVGVTSTTNQTLISACLNVWNLLWAIGAALLVDRLGRRFLFLASATTMLVSFIVITGLSASFAQSASSSIGLAVVPFLFIFFAGYDIALTPFLTAYPCEIWQFSQRSRGLTVTWVSTILAIFFNTFVNPIALDAIAWKYYFVFIGMLILLLVTVYFTYPETRGHTLEQIAVVFDKDDFNGPPAPALVAEKTDTLRRESVAEGEKGAHQVVRHEAHEL